MSIRVTPVYIITDCIDPNAVMRQSFRLATMMLKFRIMGLIGVENDLAAAGNLIDILDAAEGRRGIVIANAAPRYGQAKKWPNGTPFCYFFYGETLVISTIDGLMLSLVKKLGLVEKVNLLDIPQVVAAMVQNNQLDQTTASSIVDTQFRSFEFVPRLATWLSRQLPIPAKEYSNAKITAPPASIWWVDNFGNCKTTLLPADINGSLRLGQTILPIFPALKDVPDSQPAVVIGSSGIKNQRFMEIVIQGGRAAQSLGLRVGSKIPI